MENLTKIEIRLIKDEFYVKWPDATQILQSPQETRSKKTEASCLWLGFREGFKFAKKVYEIV